MTGKPTFLRHPREVPLVVGMPRLALARTAAALKATVLAVMAVALLLGGKVAVVVVVVATRRIVPLVAVVAVAVVVPMRVVGRHGLAVHTVFRLGHPRLLTMLV